MKENELMMKEFESKLNIVREVVDESSIQLKLERDELSRLEGELLDLSHMMELINFNASDGWRVYKEFQAVRKKRRVVKDRIEYLSIMAQFSKGTISKQAIDTTIGKIRRVKKKQLARGYRMREKVEFQEIINTQKGTLKVV